MHLLATSPLKCYTIKAHVSVSSHLHFTGQTRPALTLHGRKSRGLAKMYLVLYPSLGSPQRGAVAGWKAGARGRAAGCMRHAGQRTPTAAHKPRTRCTI